VEKQLRSGIVFDCRNVVRVIKKANKIEKCLGGDNGGFLWGIDGVVEREGISSNGGNFEVRVQRKNKKLED
jgi:hypothetical protein